MVQLSLADFYISRSLVGLELVSFRALDEEAAVENETFTICGRSLLGLQVDLDERQVYVDIFFMTFSLRG
jgi:hypothetical protein